MDKIVIFGNGEIGELAEYYFRTDSEYEVVAFTADNEYVKNDTFCGLPLIKFQDVTEIYPSDSYKMFIALSYSSMNKDRAGKYYKAKELCYDLVSYISSRCTFLTEIPIGDNCFILEDNTIQPFVRIGNNVTLWSGNHIGHGSRIENHCFISSHVVISGNVQMKPYCFIGINSSIRDSITIEKSTLIGAGSIVMEDTIEKGVYIQPRATVSEKNSDEIKI